MKKYIANLESGSIKVQANNLKEAAKFARRIARFEGDKFLSVKLCK